MSNEETNKEPVSKKGNPIRDFLKNPFSSKDKNKGKVLMDSRQGNMMENLGQVKKKKTYAEKSEIDKDGKKSKVGMNVEGNIFSNFCIGK